ncbi:hypothetical protein [uncultured Sphingomonas sp.]|uniref:hypothetical protein n=1 Tax=uncultured Sphingomonas sp. TaxID=158754 RepID=UPI0035CBA936
MNEFALCQSRLYASLLGMGPADVRHYAKMAATLAVLQANLDRHRFTESRTDAR